MPDLAQLEQFIAKGFKETTAAAMNNLEELLETLSRAKNQMRKITANQNSQFNQ